MLFWRLLSNALLFLQLLMPNQHGKLHDWAARPDDKISLSKWVFVSANVARITSFYGRRGGPSKSTFQRLVFKFEKTGSVNNQHLYVKGTQIGREHRCCPWECAGDSEAVDFSPCARTQPFADFNLANFASELEPTPIQDPTPFVRWLGYRTFGRGPRIWLKNHLFET